MKVFCNRYDCQYQNEGECCAEIISIDEDGECEDYESYLDQKEWQTPYWKRMIDRNKNQMCRVKWYGQEFEFNGRKFYVDEKGDYVLVTDGATGMSVGQRRCLEERIEKIIEFAPTIEPPLEGLPIATYDQKTRTFTYESEVEGE
jgi:hypothetical protein